MTTDTVSVEPSSNRLAPKRAMAAVIATVFISLLAATTYMYLGSYEVDDELWAEPCVICTTD